MQGDHGGHGRGFAILQVESSGYQVGNGSPAGKTPDKRSMKAFPRPP